MPGPAPASNIPTDPPPADFIHGANQYRLTLYPTLGTVLHSAFKVPTQGTHRPPTPSPKLDGILLFLHGTMVTESYPHADAEIVRRVRQAFGSEIPIVVVYGRIWTSVAMLIRNGAFDYLTGGDLVGVPLDGQRVT